MSLPLLTSRLKIQSFGQSHLDDPKYLQWLSDKENLVSLNLVDYQINPVTQERLAAYYQGFADNPRNRLFAVSLREPETFIGTATLREIGYGGLLDLGILIGDKSVRGRGFAREVIGCLVRYAFDEVGARKICSSFGDDNFAVLLAFLKNGFKIEGLQRQQMLTLEGRLCNRYIVGLLPGDLT
jgi:RimJ/RimL family protein N-acetyltransferase